MFGDEKAENRHVVINLAETSALHSDCAEGKALRRMMIVTCAWRGC